MTDKLTLRKRSTLDALRTQSTRLDARPESISYTQRQRPIPVSERISHDR